MGALPTIPIGGMERPTKVLWRPCRYPSPQYLALYQQEHFLRDVCVHLEKQQITVGEYTSLSLHLNLDFEQTSTTFSQISCPKERLHGILKHTVNIL